jgi:hypothetical protein
LLSAISTVFCNESFSLITNETTYAVDVYALKDLDSICFAGAQPTLESDIFLSYDTKPRVLAGCFDKSVRPLMPSLVSHETRYLPAGQRVVLKCTLSSDFKRCLHCHKFWHGNEMFAYQLIETKPGWHYTVKDPHAEQNRKS